MKTKINNFIKLMEYVMNETLMDSFSFLHKIQRNDTIIILSFHLFKTDKNSNLKFNIKALDSSGKDWMNNAGFDLTDSEVNDIWINFIQNFNNFNIKKSIKNLI